MLNKLNINVSSDTIGAQYLYDKGDDLVEIWLLPHRTAQAFTSDIVKPINSDFSIISVRPALSKEVSLILGSSSNFFKNLLMRNPHQNPLIYLITKQHKKEVLAHTRKLKIDAFKNLLNDEHFTDVTLVTGDDKQIRAHKVENSSVEIISTHEEIHNVENHLQSKLNTEIRPPPAPTHFKVITWNCEGFRRVSYDLFNICKEELPDFIFISEPWLFQSDLFLATKIFQADYCFSLNSDDNLDHELALTSSRAHGGTLAFWKRGLNPFVTILPVTTSRFLVLILNIPNITVSIHITIYLPTSGLDEDFIHELSNLEVTLDEMNEKYPDAPVYIRGDANASLQQREGNKRDSLFIHFCEKLGLKATTITHPTYHHFVGNSSSSIDVILQKNSKSQEEVFKILCSKANADIDSKHDMIISTFLLPSADPEPPNHDNVTAPEIPNTKHRI